MEYRVPDCCARLDSMQVTEKIKSFHSVNLQGNLVLAIIRINHEKSKLDSISGMATGSQVFED